MHQIPQLAKYKKRLAITALNPSINAKRFDNIDKAPSCSTYSKNVSTVNIEKYTGRNLR